MAEKTLLAKQADKPVTVKDTVAVGLTTGLTFALCALRAIRKLPVANPTTGKISKGIHVIYSGFREYAMREFSLDDEGFRRELNKVLVNPSEKVGDTWTALPANPDGVIESRPARGGIMLYRKGEAGAPKRDITAAMLAD